MNLHLQPKHFLFLYNCLKRCEREYLNLSEEDLLNEVVEQFENLIVGTFEDIDSNVKMTGFDKWLKSETNKIKELEVELDRIKDSVSPEDLRKKFKSVTPDSLRTKKGRPKKNK